MLATGIRRSEVIAINTDDYNTRTGQLNIQSGKGNKQRIAYLNIESRKIVKQWLNVKNQQQQKKHKVNMEAALFNPITKTGSIQSRA